MRLHCFGVNGPYPESGGATSGYLVEAGGALLQLDFGSGILGRLTAKTDPCALDALLLSHWHFDHTSDLLPLIYRLEAAGKTLPVFAPFDESSLLRRIVSASDRFRLTDVVPGETVKWGEVRVTVTPARHPVPTVGFRIEADGASLGYTGDTNTLPGLADAYRGCGLLLADALFPKEEWAENKPHLSAALAAELAAEAGAKRLLLTHLNPAYAPSLLLKQARERFSFSEIAVAGGVWAL